MLTRQEIFDKAVGGVIAQGALSTYGQGSGGCSYLMDDGRRCAAGQLIKAEHYHRDMEGCDVYSDLVAEALKLSGVSGAKRLELVAALQDAHDSARGLDEFKERARTVASEYGLNPQVAS